MAVQEVVVSPIPDVCTTKTARISPMTGIAVIGVLRMANSQIDPLEIDHKTPI
jgi:hypothetical protein